MPASAIEQRARASSPTIASRSANGASVMPSVKDGTSIATIATAAADSSGAMAKTSEALSAITGCLRRSRKSSRQGCRSGGPARPTRRACIQRITPTSVGAAASISATCATCSTKAAARFTTRPARPRSPAPARQAWPRPIRQGRVVRPLRLHRAAPHAGGRATFASRPTAPGSAGQEPSMLRNGSAKDAAPICVVGSPNGSQGGGGAKPPDHAGSRRCPGPRRRDSHSRA